MKRKHNPSGVLIVWLGNNDRIHTQSIHLNPRFPMLVKVDANAELLLKQLDFMGGDIKSMPIMTMGLTREQARLAFQSELSLLPAPNPKALPVCH